MDMVRKWLRIYASVCGGTLGRMSGPFSVVTLAIGLFFSASDEHKQAKMLFFGLAYASIVAFAVSTAIKNHALTHNREDAAKERIHKEVVATLLWSCLKNLQEQIDVAKSGEAFNFGPIR